MLFLKFSVNQKFVEDLRVADDLLKRVPVFYISNWTLIEVVRGEETPIRFMERRLLDFLINTVKNQRHMVDQDPNEYVKPF